MKPKLIYYGGSDMKKVAKTLAIIVDLLFMPIRIIVTLQMGLCMVVLCDDFDISDFWTNIIVSNVRTNVIGVQMIPKYLIKVWKGEKIEIL